jgi:hypothetical protein
MALLVGFASDARLFGRALPEHPRQVNEYWLTTYRRWIYAGGFGVQIGFGFATYIMTAATYVIAALAVLSADPTIAVLVGLVFGLVRGASILVAIDLTTQERLIRRAAALDRTDVYSLRVLVWAQAIAAIAVATAMQPVAGVVVTVLVGVGLTRSGSSAAIRLRATRSTAAITDGDDFGSVTKSI